MGGQGDAPLGVPPPLGERGGHPHSLSKRMKSDRISTEPIIFFLKTGLTDYRLQAQYSERSVPVKIMDESGKILFESKKRIIIRRT